MGIRLNFTSMMGESVQKSKTRRYHDKLSAIWIESWIFQVVSLWDSWKDLWMWRHTDFSPRPKQQQPPYSPTCKFVAPICKHSVKPTIRASSSMGLVGVGGGRFPLPKRPKVASVFCGKTTCPETLAILDNLTLAMIKHPRKLRCLQQKGLLKCIFQPLMFGDMLVFWGVADMPVTFPRGWFQPMFQTVQNPPYEQTVRHISPVFLPPIYRRENMVFVSNGLPSAITSFEWQRIQQTHIKWHVLLMCLSLCTSTNPIFKLLYDSRKHVKCLLKDVHGARKLHIVILKTMQQSFMVLDMYKSKQNDHPNMSLGFEQQFSAK